MKPKLGCVPLWMAIFHLTWRELARPGKMFQERWHWFHGYLSYGHLCLTPLLDHKPLCVQLKLNERIRTSRSQVSWYPYLAFPFIFLDILSTIIARWLCSFFFFQEPRTIILSLSQSSQIGFTDAICMLVLMASDMSAQNVRVFAPRHQPLFLSKTTT